MADGLERATLAALCSQGPWEGKQRTCRWMLTGVQLAAVHTRIARGDDPYLAAARLGLHPRAAERAKELLRDAGLIEYLPIGKRWRVTGGGDAA